MKTVELQDGEKEILHTKYVSHGAFDHAYGEEFYLTNLHLICIKRGCFGKIKSEERFILSEIPVDEEGNARLIMDGSKKNNGPKLQIFFGNIPFNFYFMEKSTANEWGNLISQMLTGKPMRNLTVENITKVVKEIKSAIEKEFQQPASATCEKCGAQISGYRGEMATCPFCNTQQML